MFSKIITLSLNPALDLTLWTDTLMPDSDNVVQDERYDAAGKAVNVSRTLRYYDVDNLAKQLLDAMTRLRFWDDDRQIVELTCRKRYAEEPRWEICVQQVPEMAL